MAERNDKRFSEDAYATKEDVSKAFNLTSVDFIWNDVVNYRKGLTQTLELPNNDKTKFSLVMTHSIMNRLLAYERNLTKAFYIYNQLSDFGKNDFSKKRLLKILGNTGAASGSKQSDTFLLTLISGTTSAIPNDAVIIKNYQTALKFISHHDGGDVSYMDFNALNSILNSGTEPEGPLKDKNYRTTAIEEPHYYQTGYVYKAALTDRIDEMMESLSAFINDGSQFISVRAIGALYYSLYIKPYEYFFEPFSALCFKMALAKNGYALFASFINIEGLILFKDEALKKADENVQKNFDLTYFYDMALNYLNDDISDIFADIEEVKKDEVSHEMKSVGLSPSEKALINESEPKNFAKAASPETPAILTPTPAAYKPAETPAVKPASPDAVISAPAQQIYGPVNVAIPVFPKGFEDADVEKVTVDLMETYPTLRRSQAHFYASHCTVGRSYTIQEFKKSEVTSYETARTSMDYLSQLGFYEKAKVRNKFVYRPIPRR